MLAAFTTGEIASMCSVSPRTVSKWVDSGQLRGYRIGQDRRVPDDILRTFCRNTNMPLPVALAPKVLVTLPKDDMRSRLANAVQERFEPIYDVGSMFHLGLLIKDDCFRGMIVDCSCSANRAYVRLVRKFRSDVRIIGLSPDDDCDTARLQLSDQFRMPVDMQLVAERLITLMYRSKKAA